jgi:hypothetical protein
MGVYGVDEPEYFPNPASPLQAVEQAIARQPLGQTELGFLETMTYAINLPTYRYFADS